MYKISEELFILRRPEMSSFERYITASPDEASELSRKHYRELQRKYVIRLTFTYLVPLIILSVFFLYSYNALLNESRNAKLKSLVDDQANLLDLYLRERLFTLTKLIENPVLPIPPDSDYMQNLFELLKIDSDTYVDIGFFDHSGVLTAYAGPYPELKNKNYSDRSWYKNLRYNNNTYIISDLHLGFRNKPHFTIAIGRIIDERYYVLRATLDPDKFYSYISSLESDEGIESYIINREGHFQVVTSALGRPLSTSGIIPPITPGINIGEIELSGKKITYAYSWLKMADWALIMQGSQLHYIGFVENARFYFLILSIVFALAIFTFIIIQAKGIAFHQKEIDETRAQLEHAERMVSTGQLAAGVAHEINNPLTGVLTSGHILLKRTPEDHEYREDLEIIVNETTRCRKIIRNLLDFARQIPSEKTMANMTDILTQTASIIGNQLKKHNIVLENNLSSAIPDMMIDVNQMVQVFVNIILNAIEAMPGGGTINISEKIENDVVKIKVRDTGSGIPDKIVNKIFDPFFTTKSAQKGTGLGLSVSYGIIKKHNGSIDVFSESGKGATFIIKLPIG
ncbi:ATP-binding protein [candidate division KSB1 bacterium]